MTSDVTVVGLGAMGTALARALLAAGREVTVWNRTAEKMQPLVDRGARPASDLSEAIAASPRSVICLMNYSTTNSLFESSQVSNAVVGRNIVQLGTSTPQESEDSQTKFNDWGAGYIDGTIMCWPGNIGTPTGRIAVAGSKSAFADCETDLGILAGDLRYVGSNARAAATLELAFLSRLLGIIFGSIHGALVCEAEGVPVSEFTSILPPGDRAIPLTETIQAGSFDRISKGGASVDVAGEAVTGLYNHAVSVGINSELPALMREWVKRAQAAGYGKQETAAVIKTLRQNN
ncbi:NAD(P)-dependent oxidoreductase [Pseudohalocynthiibacter aestuariivivens]|uniref:NAD(P)-dependent oxidoreductase n=1 Tax=Pseudohalocynthiibacter aestuariivivens TaxID=1591409 RepID=UPI001BD6DE68|nr:NAD(P)-binding domain-containing protein [Pseudohalocynthiibacter aestuariivivens]MBS9718532.1 NAD(P)-dependent oxidoreductase [Pseudohalocynthiibacter aestuariivivens]